MFKRKWILLQIQYFKYFSFFNKNWILLSLSRYVDPVIRYNASYGGNSVSNYNLRPECEGHEGSFEMCRFDKQYASENCPSAESIGVECRPQAAGN